MSNTFLKICLLVNQKHDDVAKIILKHLVKQIEVQHE